MSRLGMSPAALRAVFSPDADSDLFMLVTIYDPLNPANVVARITDGYTQRLTQLETPTQEVYGVVSRGQSFIFLPVQITLPSEEEAQAPRCSITINDVTRYLTPTIRNLTAPPKVKLELVLSSSTDLVEVSFTNFFISSFTYNANTVTAELSMTNYDVEPFPQHSFIPKYFPGLF